MASASSRFALSLFRVLLGLGSLGILSLKAGPWVPAGPAFDKAPSTLQPGVRTEAIGPFWRSGRSGLQSEWAIPPLFSNVADPDTDSEHFDFLYPLLTYNRHGKETRFQFIQLFSHVGGASPKGAPTRRFTIFPLYFQQRSADPKNNYTAIVPFYGHLENRLFEDEINFVLLPFYLRTRKRDVVTDHYLFPFFHLRHGPGLRGWQVWPLVGHETKAITTQTNGFGDVETIGGYRKWFALWPFFFNQHLGIGTANPQTNHILLPFFSLQRSPQRDSSSYLWPLITYTVDRQKQYREFDFPYPLIVFARGKGKTANRVWPFFSRAKSPTQESDFYLWPVYKFNRIHSDPLDRERTRIFFFLYSDVKEKNTATGTQLRRIDFWPFFTSRVDHHGRWRFQALALLEPFLPGNDAIQRVYSPLWSLWRVEKNPKTGVTDASLLWNLYHVRKTPHAKKYSFLFGLFQYQSDEKGRHWRLFYLPPITRKASARAQRRQPLQAGRPRPSPVSSLFPFDKESSTN